MRALLLVTLISALFLFGCTQAPATPVDNTTKTQNQTIPQLAAVTAVAPTTPAVVAQSLDGDFCIVKRPGIEEYVLLDKNRYAYEGRVNGNLATEMIFTGGNLYLHVIPAVKDCDWALFNQQDLSTVHKLGDLLLLNYTEMRSRLLLSQCTRSPIAEKVFTLPAKSCTARELLIKALAGQPGAQNKTG